MQSTGQGSRHLSHPEQSSGRIMTSIPWLKMAPKLGGQARRHASQFMHCDMSIYIGTFGHLLLRSLLSIRDKRAGLVPDAIYRILWGHVRSESTTASKGQDTLGRCQRSTWVISRFHSCAAWSSRCSDRSYSVTLVRLYRRDEFGQCFAYRHDIANRRGEKSRESVLQRRPKKNCGTRPQERPSRWFGSLNFETIASDLANLEPYFGQSTLRIKHSQSTHIRNFL